MRTIKQKVYHSRSYKYVLIGVLILFLFCILFKCCSTDSYNSVSQIRYNNLTYPDKPNYLVDIDTNDIRISPKDPLKRKKLNGVLNVYLQDSLDVVSFCKKLADSDTSQVFEVNFYAQEYNSVQFKILEEEQSSFIRYLESNFNTDIKFILEEWIFSSSNVAFNDELFSQKDNYWFYEYIGLPAVWEKETGNEDVLIAVIDDGFDKDHLELYDQFYKPWNVYDYSGNIDYKGGKSHGTHVSGTVVANADNEKGIAGVAPGCRVVPVQVANEQGVISMTSVINGIFYALKNDVDIINISLALSLPGVSNLSSIEQEIIGEQFLKSEERLWNEIFRIADKEGVIVVQAAGNDNVKANVDPMKRSKYSIVVGALDRNGMKASFSNYGKAVDIYAPGVDILSTTPEDNFMNMDGTSMASPIVSGSIALLKSKNKSLTRKDIIRGINSSTKRLGMFGKPVLNIEELYNSI